MADISYLQNEDLGDTDETVADKDDEEIGSEAEDCSSDEGVGVDGDEGGGADYPSALVKLQLEAASPTIFNRQMVGRVLVDIFRNAVDTGIQLPIEEIMIPIGKIAADPEATVRSELVEQVPHVAMICEEAPNRFRHVLPQHLLGIVIKYLRDDDNQVRKTAQAALLVLMERGLLEKEPIEELICPVVLELSFVNDPSVEIHTGAIALMCKMAPLVGRELTERLFLDRFAKLCSDDIFYVRKVCAANLADFCAAVSKESIETILLPRFIDLCTDDVWGVRKACAEVIMSVSCCVSLHHRQHTLAPVFAALLGDVSKWVRMSAFQTLGPFISTFAQQFTALAYNQYGEVVFTNQQGMELRYNKLSYSNPRTLNFCETSSFGCLSRKYDEYNDKFEVEFSPVSMVGSRNRDKDEDGFKPASESTVTEESGSSDDTDKFNPFLFYYISPDMPLDLDLVEAGRPTNSENGNAKEEAPSLDKKKENQPVSNDSVNNADDDVSGSVSVENSSQLLNDTIDVRDAYDERKNITQNANGNSGNKCNAAGDNYQCVVPQVLIDYFVSMTETTQVVQTDSEILQHCAFSFPAVALTLEKHNWPLLKDAYLSLASALPWKVRLTLASSIHEIALILGEDLAARDLVPIYDGFIKDLDEVRIGALKHLATFLKVLRPSERCQYLPRLNNFLVTDAEWNWRFREELANQLLEAVTLFNPYDVSKYIAPLSLHLLVDKIAAVRTVALALVTQIISHLSVDEALVTALVQELGHMLPRSVKWTRRQTYGILCSQLITNGAITADRFSKEMLPHLIDLSWDTVPNVRLAVARTLARNVATRGPEWQGGPEQAEAVKTKLKHLRQDVDRDVREHAILIRTQ
ncbi:serine/threonine-protein phosphatase 4 regulatory subunit 1 isoform X1 [Neodiprion lecontei]|uniref:Serine/threonine-protein phosphatase 4 regulatory subunit 1 isoform X1 n=2 Tax=Neodiprion lecontei TaxID=441921 RepID=A0ABM3FJR8_NEOLC|nr:serine/threonine-protein phosphatase 4 regulatory subunit 1 isoform X1 [Neodiprion lecontei]